MEAKTSDMILGKPSSSNKPVLLFSNPPNFEELCVISLFVTNPQQSVHSSRNQTQILKCRELIFTEPDIIATPSFGDDHSITLILQHSLHATGRLQARFLRIGLKASKPSSVTPALYQACMTYTLHAKLAPTWNKAGQWLLQGRDFLTTRSCLNAVKMSLTVSGNDISMALQATAVRTSPFQLNALNLPTSVQREFLREPHAVIPETFLMNTWCHVLPSMKKGKIVGVSKVIPEESPFKTYRDLKRHWKNTYGYRLPETEDNVLYYQIYFRPIGQTLFTYPDVCIRSREFHVLPRVDPRSIYASFLQDVTAKMPTLCGQHLNFKPKVKYAKPGLSAASENLNQPNLSNRMIRPSYNSRDPSELQNVYESRSQNDQLSMRTTPPSVSMTRDCSISTTSHLSAQTQPVPQPSVNKVVNSTGKIVPVFRSKVALVYNRALQKRPVEKKLVPVFRATKTTFFQNITGQSEMRVSSLQNQYPSQELQHHSITLCEKRNPTQSSPGLFERKIDCPILQLDTRPSTSTASVTPSVTPFLIHGNLEEGDFQLPCPPMPTSQIEFIGKSSLYSVKRKANLDSPVVKKARSKPQIQEDVNVEVLAKTHQLSKVNAATLVAWMKEHNIPCKAKDKKTDLIDKVNSFLQVSSSEQ